jgi:hypothetical protein
MDDRLRQAFQALLRGDLAERDRICDEMLAELEEEERRKRERRAAVRSALERPIRIEHPDKTQH